MPQSVVLFGLAVASLAMYACLGEHPGVSSEDAESEDPMIVETIAMADQTNTTPQTPESGSVPENWAELAREDWKRILTDEQYRILREAGTERPFSGKYWKDNGGETGVFKCNVCLQPLFTRESKFFSSCGWPAFQAEVDGHVSEHSDTSHGMVRTEVRCHNCDSHLGHVFNDGPAPTGLRYCINSECIVYDEDGTIADKPVTPAERLRIAEQEGQAG